VAYRISEERLRCGVCEPEWRNQAIRMGDDYHKIDPERCKEWIGFFDQPQCRSVCPNETPGTDPARRESKET
jgi:hypothetical protein